jgi:very-short-patch-repair endonuclease
VRGAGPFPSNRQEGHQGNPMDNETALVTEIKVETNSRVNFAMQQNDVPVVQAVRIENRTSNDLGDLQLRITSDPGFLVPLTMQIASVGASSSYSLPEIDLELSPKFLGEITERIRGQFRFELLRGEQLLAQHVEPVLLLARDEWSGLSVLPEILAAFVTPNHPAIDGLLRDAADLLGSWGHDTSLSGYQSGQPRHVYAMVAAIYAAVQRSGITYVNPPASFENEGQRIRLPGRIAGSQLATCLDLSALAAGCLEQAGLNSLIVLVNGHAVCGVWLQDECFAQPAVDDPLRLRKRVDLSEIAVFDPTSITSRPPRTFEDAVREARRRLEDPDEFLCAIDIQRARKGQIRPIPEREEGDGPADEVEVSGQVDVVPAAPDRDQLELLDTLAETSAERDTPETSGSRLERWRRRLLDLSLRNRLINFRETKRTVPLLKLDLSEMEDAIADGATFKILARPEDLGDADTRSGDAHRRRTSQEGLDSVVREELRAKRLRADLTSDELERRLVELYRAARTGREEGGASALYLAVGFLQWYETHQSAQPRLAPILLLPVDLARKSVREGYSLTLGDDEPRLNMTLIELLRHDHGITVSGLDPLPEDETGLDVQEILRVFRYTVRDIGRWDVLDRAQVGIFSFAKFLMWRDLTERVDDLTENSVVDHLVNHPNEQYEPGAVFPDPDMLDEHRTPQETFCPLPTDASQLAAIHAAAEGRSFVLEGPPGTGKSQTITNLISHCLTEGKTVLFVSEKMAALNVVYDRLQRIGVGRHCLALHSNKASKREVLAQLAQTLQAHNQNLPDQWEQHGLHLNTLRQQLNAYAEALHKRRKTGETVFQATSTLIGLADSPRIELGWASPDSLDADQLIEIRNLVDRLATTATALGEVHDHPWITVQTDTWTPSFERDVRSAISDLQEKTSQLDAQARAIAEPLGFCRNRLNADELAALTELATLIPESAAPPNALLTQPGWEEIRSTIHSWVGIGRRRDELRSGLFGRFRDGILDLDLDALQERLERARNSGQILAWWQRRFVRKALKLVSREGTAPRKDEVSEILGRARELLGHQRTLDSGSEEACALLGRHWKSGDADWERVDEVLNWARRIREIAADVSGSDIDRILGFRETWARLANEGQDLVREDGPLGQTFSEYRDAYRNYDDARSAIEALLKLDPELAWGATAEADVLSETSSALEAWSNHYAKLRGWCAWRNARAQAVKVGLSPLVEAYERKAFQSDAMRQVFERSYYEWWHAAVVSAEPVLSSFFSPEHERKIEQFRLQDESYLGLTREFVCAQLASKVPASSTAAHMPNSEVGILSREMSKRRRHMPVRKLFQQIPNLLPRLAPCLLMSPLSVAQYLDPSYPRFDLVVFDEASQIPVWDAVGAIARGKQAVVVGDPKQLPPTTFFQRGDDPDEDTESETVEDLESILDECIGARIPWLPLNWHYRSRHESLIAFSNYHYYNNRLLTFPSPRREGMGVSWRLVPNGVYDRGKSATNRAEADAVVGEVIRRLENEHLRVFTIGVVTFSQAQQTLIEDLLDEARRRNEILDSSLAEDIEEPIFVKNLENVQGDERDVILFSVCYGPDPLGRVSMNFGPMNREGGERRLNVAITRARTEVVVFSSIRADQIDLSRTRARGVRDLKHFLEYAEHGPSALVGSNTYDADADFDSPFEEAVYKELVHNGWEVHKQVGCANYRIDLAVVDPEAPGKYIMGIECDGANYHRAKTARDRDKLREGVLTGLGWRIVRVWSTDWWTDPKTEVEKLTTALDNAVSDDATTPVAPSVPAEPNPPVPVEPGEPIRPEPIDPPQQPTDSLPTYVPYIVTKTLGPQEDFYDPDREYRIKQVISDVVEEEGPMSLDLATRRVAAHWGFRRIHNKAINVVRRSLDRSQVSVATTSVGEFLWPISVDPSAYADFRVPGDLPESTRDSSDLPPEEIANAALHLLRRHVSVPEEELVRETSRLFGFKRTGSSVVQHMVAGIEVLLAREEARRDGAMIVVVGD